MPPSQARFTVGQVDPATRMRLRTWPTARAARSRLGWIAHWRAGEVVAVDMDGTAEVMAEGPARMGWSIDWLPDGRLITTGPSATRHEPDGARVM